MPTLPTTSRSCAAFVLATLGAAACGSAGTTDPVDHSSLHQPSSVSNSLERGQRLAQAVQRETVRFQAYVLAKQAGYAPASPCIASPAGGMGFHWVNDALVDPVFNPLKPEALLYLPGVRDKQTLVAVEYIVINVGQPAPTFDGHPFDVGGTPVAVPHWSLHLWVHRPNPSGLFAPFNPNVVCPGP